MNLILHVRVYIFWLFQDRALILSKQLRGFAAENGHYLWNMLKWDAYGNRLLATITYAATSNVY